MHRKDYYKYIYIYIYLNSSCEIEVVLETRPCKLLIAACDTSIARTCGARSQHLLCCYLSHILHLARPTHVSSNVWFDHPFPVPSPVPLWCTPSKYTGLIQHRTGIEAWTKMLIKEHYPEVRDVKLVTNRTRDRRDH